MMHFHAVSPLIAAGVLASTAATDAVYVMFNAAVTARRRTVAASWSSLWYLLAAFAVISYTGNPWYVLFAAAGSWVGAFGAVTWIRRGDRKSATGTPAQLDSSA
ncbi:MAG TPA: hypothetical protein VII48_04345 [Rhizomicrobium sp.]